MPKKRKTHLAKRAKPKLPDGEDLSGLSEQEKAEKKALFLKDFDLAVNARIATMRKEALKMCTSINQCYKMELFKLPKEVRDMKRSEYLARGGTINTVKLKEISKTVDSLAISLVSTLTSSKSNGRCPLGNMVNTIDNESMKQETIKEEVLTSSEDMQPTETKRTGRQGKSKAKMQTSESQDEGMSLSLPPAQTTIRRSTRKAARKNQFATPVMSASAVRLNPAAWDTPAITPKFDPRLPLTPAVLRHAKHGETIMALSGSPVFNPSDKATKVPGTSVHFKSGKVLQISADQKIDNDTTRKNLILLQKEITKILQNSSSSDA